MKKIFIIINFSIFILLSNLFRAQSNSANSATKSFMHSENIILSGESKLSNGIVSVLFNKKLNEYLTDSKYIISLTPIGSWSALYIEQINENGFTVKSEQGDLNASFFWIMTIQNQINERE